MQWRRRLAGVFASFHTPQDRRRDAGATILASEGKSVAAD
jgi:hypothetical protein